MRGSSVAVGLSVLAHVLIGVIAASRTSDTPTLDLQPVPVVASPPAAVDTEITVALFSDESPPAAAVIHHDTRVVSRDARLVTSATSPGRTETMSTRPSSTGTTPSTDAKPKSPLAMRQPGDDKPSLVLGHDFVSDFLAHDKPLAPPPDLPGERVGNDIADLRQRLAHSDRYSPEEIEAMRNELVARNEERENEELKPSGGGTYETQKKTFTAKVAPDGTVKIEEHDGLMDRFMKKHGVDPYASNKRDYLDRTRDQRVAIGKRNRTEELKHSTNYMQQNIARLWAMTTDVQQRKQGLFDLWDECAETGSPEEIAGGADARAFVMNHIRGSVTYTADELRVLNAHRHSAQPFAP